MCHIFRTGQTVWAKNSGKSYTVIHLRSEHPKLKGEPGYVVRGNRDGKSFGPWRLMRESALYGKDC